MRRPAQCVEDSVPRSREGTWNVRLNHRDIRPSMEENQHFLYTKIQTRQIDKFQSFCAKSLIINPLLHTLGFEMFDVYEHDFDRRLDRISLHLAYESLE